MAVALLAQSRYRVTASTGRPGTDEYLKQLGGCEIMDGAELLKAAGPLQRETWSGVVDSVGSTMMANALAPAEYGAAVTACALASGTDLPATVLPHILRRMALLGIVCHGSNDQAPCGLEPPGPRAGLEDLETISTVEPMSRLPQLAEGI